MARLLRHLSGQMDGNRGHNDDSKRAAVKAAAPTTASLLSLGFSIIVSVSAAVSAAVSLSVSGSDFRFSNEFICSRNMSPDGNNSN